MAVNPIVNPDAVKVKVNGSWRKSIPLVRVAGKYYNPRQVYVKVSGVWRLCYTNFTWTYSWRVGSWSSCGAIGTYQTRSVTCIRSPDNVTVNNSFCQSAGAKPITSQICNCNCKNVQLIKNINY